MTALVCSGSLKNIQLSIWSSIRCYHVGKASSVNTAILKGIRKSKGLALRGKTHRDPNDARERLKERLKDLPCLRPRPGRPAQRQPEVIQGAWPSRKRFSDGKRSGAPEEKLGTSRSASKATPAKRHVEESQVKGFGRPRDRPLSIAGRSTSSLFKDGRAEGLQRRGKRRAGDQSSIKLRGGQDYRTNSLRSLTEWGRDTGIDSHPVQASHQMTDHRKRRGDVRVAPEERRFSDRFRSDRTSNAARSAAERDGVHSNLGHDRSSGYYSSENRNDEDSPAPIVKRIADRKMPLSIPYTTPASEFLYGASVVEAALKSRRSPRRQLYKLYIYDSANRENPDQDDEFERLASSQNIPVMRVGADWSRFMEKMSTGRPHNGYILEASPLPRLPVTSLDAVNLHPDEKHTPDSFSVTLDHQSKEEAAISGTTPLIRIAKNHHGRHPLVLYLDSIVDPANLGSIVRTASFLGVSALAISSRNSAPFTPVVLKASAGASENMSLLSVNKPAQFIADSRLAGWKIYAAVAPDPPESLTTDDHQHLQHHHRSHTPSLAVDELKDPLADAPCILMLGSEGEGLRWNLRSKADVELYIRGSGWRGSVDSLNVNVAAGILCSAFIRRGKVVREVKPVPNRGDLF